MTELDLPHKQKDQISALLEDIVNSMPQYIFWKDLNSIYLGCNQNYAELVGLNSPADIIGLSEFDLNWQPHGHSAEFFVARDKEAIAGKVFQDFEQQLNTTDGRVIIVNINKHAFLDDNGKVQGVLGVANDITELKDKEKELQLAQKKAADANKDKIIAEEASIAKDEFLRNMRHDIRTPFCGILGIAEILKEKETDDEKRTLLHDLILSAQNILNFLNEILDFTQIELGFKPIISTNFDARKLVNDIKAMMLAVIAQKQITLNLDIEKNVPFTIIGDIVKLKRILINLISNAIKFTEEGSVDVTVSVASIDKNQTTLNFIIHDSGIGIAKENIERIFERFTRITPNYKGIYEGTGLGLYVVKQLLNKMGGTIKIESEPGTGSTFTCNIPFLLPDTK